MMHIIRFLFISITLPSLIITFHMEIWELGSLIDNEQAIYNDYEIKNPFENVHDILDSIT